MASARPTPSMGGRVSRPMPLLSRGGSGAGTTAAVGAGGVAPPLAWRRPAAPPIAAASGPAAAAAAAAAGSPPNPEHHHLHHSHRRRRPDVSTAAKKRPPPGDGGGSSSSKAGAGGDDGEQPPKKKNIIPPVPPPPPPPPAPSGKFKPPPRGGAGGSERADKSKADFSAYWALRFREFFSKRKAYLDLANKPAKGDADTPDLVERVIASTEAVAERALEDEVARLEAAGGGEEGLRVRSRVSDAVAAQDDEIRRRTGEQVGRIVGQKRVERILRARGGAAAGGGGGGAAGGGGGGGAGGGGGNVGQQRASAEGDPSSSGPVLTFDRRVDPDELELMQAREARAYVGSARVRVLYNGMQAAARAARLIVTAPVAVPLALWRSWRAIFETPEYGYWVDREVQRLWYWRNRTENERWFWEIYFWDRVFLPTLWTLVYVAAAPPNLLWCALVPLLMLGWRDGRMQGPGDYEWWLLMVFGVFGKCRGQIADIVRTALSWGV